MKEEKMADTLDPKTFDLIAVLSGRSLPTSEVGVYFEESIGFEIYRLQQEINKTFEEKDLLEKEERLKSLIEKSESLKYTVVLQAVPKAVLEDIAKAVLEEFPSTKDAFGREKEHPLAQRDYVVRVWAASIQKVIDPTGAVSLVDIEVARALYENAPDFTQEAILEGIAELREGVKSGFEIASKEANFLLSASPEG